jgi:hypothetical protein
MHMDELRPGEFLSIDWEPELMGRLHPATRQEGFIRSGLVRQLLDQALDEMQKTRPAGPRETCSIQQ